MRFSLFKAIRNDRLLNNVAEFAAIVLIFLVLNLGFGINITKSKVYFERNFFIARFEVAALFILALIIAFRVLRILHLFRTGEKVSARVLGKDDFLKCKSSLRVSFEMNGEQMSEEIVVENTTAADNLAERGDATLFVSKKNPRRAIVADLLFVCE